MHRNIPACEVRRATAFTARHYHHMITIGKWLQRLAGGRRTLDPISGVDQDLPRSTSKYEFSIVACARWEEVSIQEWVEYHKSIGFSHIYLYSNDDNPMALFRAIAPYTYGADPFVTFLHWRHIGQQVQIYLHFLKTFKQETTWFSFLDIDEFFVLKEMNNIARFMKGYEASVDCLYFNWVLYGNNDKVQREDGATLTSYPRRSREPDVHTKLLCRSASIDAVAIEQGHANGHGAFHHFLDNYKLPGLRCFDVLLGSTEGYSANFVTSAKPFVERDGFSKAILQCAYIAHFQFRSEQDFMRRWRRGGFGQDEAWREAFESGRHKSILTPRNEIYDTYLAAYWHRYTANAMRTGLATASPDNNIALNKPSWQSSVYLPDTLEPASSRTAGGGNNGVRTGTYGFHTNHEYRPWWIVDLLKTHRITTIHIYNRCDQPVTAARANELDVLASLDGLNWNTLWSNSEQTSFSLDGVPLIVTVPRYLNTRFVLLRLRGSDCLHLDEIEVYGTDINEPVPLELPAGAPFVTTE